MKRRILAVDDESDWLDNLKAWVPEEIAIQDSADTTLKAIELLRRYYYDLVLLDLSMVLGDQANRDNDGIQTYLATRPEGTRYIIVSGTMQREEVREAAFRGGAFYVLFKPEAEPNLVRSKVEEALDDTSRNVGQALIEARTLFLREADERGPHDLLTTLKPKGGAMGLRDVFDTAFRRLVPIATHRVRTTLAVQGDTVVGLVWSRQLGKAVSIAFVPDDAPAGRARNALTEWLGYREREEEFAPIVVQRVQVHCFAEPSGALDDFTLPVIAPPPTNPRWFMRDIPEHA